MYNDDEQNSLRAVLVSSTAFHTHNQLDNPTLLNSISRSEIG